MTFQPIAALAMLLICFGLALPAHSDAQEPEANAPFAIQTTLEQLLGKEVADRYEQYIAPDEAISWRVYIPRDPEKRVPGVLVYVSPVAEGWLDKRWLPALDAHNLIYIAANGSGNSVHVKRRMILALMALQVLAQRYTFASERILVSGFSGGGRTASMLATQYPDVFRGALYICGVDPLEKKLTPKMEQLVQNRFVFLTGARDFNREETQSVHRQYLRADANNSKLMVIPGMTHKHPDGQAFDEAIQFLLREEQQ